MTYAETRALVLRLLPKDAVGAEIGVWKGDFSQQILDAATPKLLHLIDPWAVADDPAHAKAWYSAASGTDMDAIYKSVQVRFADHVRSGQVQIHRQRSQSAMNALPDETLDFVYVDGDHAYAAVREDLELAIRKTKPGALICVDDYYKGKWWGDGVVRAVNEVLGARALDLTIILAANAQVVIKKG